MAPFIFLYCYVFYYNTDMALYVTLEQQRTGGAVLKWNQSFGLNALVFYGLQGKTGLALTPKHHLASL